jgi:hypothetical protein
MINRPLLTQEGFFYAVFQSCFKPFPDREEHEITKPRYFVFFMSFVMKKGGSFSHLAMTDSGGVYGRF